MTLPNFLGIGAARSGSTWLHYLLASHPAIYVPEKRKELAYFDKLYEQHPMSWYRSFFPTAEQSTRYKAIGEVTPTYLYCEQCPTRILELGTVDKLIVILRNPIARAYSQYGLQVRDYAQTISFEDALQVHAQLIDRGLYAKHLTRYLQVFERHQLLVICFETAVANVRDTQSQLATFLGVDATQFTDTVDEGRRNASMLPRFSKLYAWLAWLGRRLRRYDMDWVVNFGRKIGMKRLISSNKQLPAMLPATRTYLATAFRDDVQQLRTLFPIDFAWPEFDDA